MKWNTEEGSFLYLIIEGLHSLLNAIEKGKINGPQKDLYKVELLIEINMNLIDSTLGVIRMSDIKDKKAAALHFANTLIAFCEGIEKYKLKDM